MAATKPNTLQPAAAPAASPATFSAEMQELEELYRQEEAAMEASRASAAAVGESSPAPAEATAVAAGAAASSHEQRVPQQQWQQQQRRQRQQQSRKQQQPPQQQQQPSTEELRQFAAQVKAQLAAGQQQQHRAPRFIERQEAAEVRREVGRCQRLASALPGSMVLHLSKEDEQQLRPILEVQRQVASKEEALKDKDKDPGGTTFHIPLTPYTRVHWSRVL